jgi:hypothetical protein
METNIKIEIGSNGLPTQRFNGKEYYLYPKERYFSKGCNRLHKVVYESFNGKVPKGYQIHHKDSNTWNNNINNLECIEVNKHLSEHGKQRVKNNPEWFKSFYEKGVESAKEWHKSDDGKKWHSEHGKEIYAKRIFNKHVCEVCKKEYQTRHTGRTKYCHQNCKAKALRARRKLSS